MFAKNSLRRASAAGPATRSSLARIALASTGLLLGACAGQQARLSSADREALASAPRVHAVRHKAQAAFSYESAGYTAAGILFTPLVAVGQAYEGIGLQQEFHLEDPVGRVQDRLIRQLREDLKVADVEVMAEAPRSDDVVAILKAHPDATVLDIRTLKWGLDGNRAVYHARARLLRASRANDILWQGICKFVAEKDKPAPTTADLKADGAHLLKAGLLAAADGCADQLVKWIASQDR